MFNLFASKRINFYQVTAFFMVAFVTAFLALNFVPTLTKSGNSSAADADVSMEVGVAISLNLSKEAISLETTPTREGEFVYDTTVAKVSTNNTTGYTLTMNTVTDQTALADEDRTIPSITTAQSVTATDQSAFTKDAWGYAKSNGLNTSGDTTFNQIPSLSVPATIASSEDPVTEDTTPITYGTKISTNTMAGEYQNTVAFTATTNYVPQTFGGIMYMQEMTADICAAETTPDKTATKSTAIHSKSTGLVPEAVLTDSRDGEQYIVRKLADGNCWMSQDLRLVGGKTLTSADSDVASDFALPASTSTSGWSSANQYTAMVGPVNATHGNGAYYNWYTATAGTGDNTITHGGDEISSSICPKGWRLPHGGLNQTGNQSFTNLISTAYGYTSTPQILAGPLQYEQGGAYVGSTLNQAGSYGYYWSSTVFNDANAYILNFSDSSFHTHVGSNRYYGFSVRCIARNTESYTISFDMDGGDNLGDMTFYLDDVVNLATISAKASKSGHTLTGWKDQDGTTYGTTGIVNINPDSKSTITLTAVWEKNITFFPSTLTTMQGMTADICNAVTTPSKDATASATSEANYTDPDTQVPQVTLTDTRDNNTYTVKKLADGNCWMTQNLRIVGSRTLTSADSDVSSNYTLPAAQTSAFTDTSNNNQVGAVQSSYGNGAYYSWYAATAGTGTAAMSMAGQDATSSICPKGWRLPPYSGNKSYYNLLTTTYAVPSSSAGVTTLQAQPLQFVLAGSYFNSGFVYGGLTGDYWSSSVYNASRAYYLGFGSYNSIVNPRDRYDKFSGFSVRCVAR